MELQDIYYNKPEYIETASGNKVSRQSVLCGSQNIVLNGKAIIQSDCIIRGDLASVRVGRHCVISKRSVIRPPFKKFNKGVAFFPLVIGDHVFIDEDSIVNAAHIGSYVYIGKNCVISSKGKMVAKVLGLCDLPPTNIEYTRQENLDGIDHWNNSDRFLENIQGRRSILKDCCMIADNTVLPPETVVPTFTVYSGSPGICSGELSECTQDLMTNFTKSYYQHFLPIKIE